MAKRSAAMLRAWSVFGSWKTQHARAFGLGMPPPAKQLPEAYEWYERHRIGLGEEFLSKLDACIQAILRYPGMYRVVHEHYRRGLLRRFPSAVFYEEVHDAVTVYGIFHTARDPAKWRRRLS